MTECLDGNMLSEVLWINPFKGWIGDVEEELKKGQTGGVVVAKENSWNPSILEENN